MDWRQLDRLGLGLSADVASSRPDWRKFLGGANAIDYLNFGAHFNQLERLEYYISDIRGKIPIVFHPLDFNVALGHDEPKHAIEGVANVIGYLGACWAGQDIAIWRLGGVYQDALLVPPVFDYPSVHEAAKKVKSLQAYLPCPFLIENPPVAFAMGDLHVLEFLGCVANEADCGIVLDIGHLLSFQAAVGRPYGELPWRTFPFDRVVEIHLAGLGESLVGGDLQLIDRHDLPITEESWELLQWLLPRTVNLKGLTLEQEFCDEHLICEHISRARSLLNYHAT